MGCYQDGTLVGGQIRKTVNKHQSNQVVNDFLSDIQLGTCFLYNGIFSPHQEIEIVPVQRCLNLCVCHCVVLKVWVVNWLGK